MQIIGRAIRKVMGASTLIGDDVKNQSGENLGKIEEIVLDVPSGTVQYAVLSFGGGFLGIGDKLFAVPWRVLQLDEDNKCFVLNVSKDKLENAPGFDKKNWPDFADAEFGGKIYDYYGIERLTSTAVKPNKVM
jgi:sporulation protein YlmC with PRC-barrel domain